MRWLINLEALEESEDNSYYCEYEIASEVFISGELNYANGKIFCRRLMIEKDQNDFYQYYLRIKYSQSENKKNIGSADKHGYYFLDGELGELLSLFSVFFQCRLYAISHYYFLGDNVRVKEECNFLYLKCDKKIHPTIFNDIKRSFDPELNLFLDSLRKLPTKKHQRFMLACYHYARSLKEVGIDSEMVFIRLISAIEALSKDYKIPDDSNNKDPLFGQNFDDLFENAILCEGQKQQLKDILKVDSKGKITVTDKIKLKFKEFVLFYSKDFFNVDRNIIPPLIFEKSDTNNDKKIIKKTKYFQVTYDNLLKILDIIYDARSKYLHIGEPLYMSRTIYFDHDFDFEPSTGRLIDNREFECEKLLPYAYSFESIVRHCLLKYLEEKKTNT